MTTFAFERGTAFVGELLGSMELLRSVRDALAEQAAGEPGSAPTRAADDLDRDDQWVRVGLLGARLEALWALARRNVSAAGAGGAPGPGGNIFKLAFSELRQDLADLAMDVIGTAALARSRLASVPLDNDLVVDVWLNGMSRTIAAGTSQVQRTILGERVLGLPRD
jgi:alkylation response protein AidB-like acyl-CoA dehydrogenase